MCLFLATCGGPKVESKIANAIQTLMSNTIEAFATKETGATSVTFNCGDGSGDQGSFSYSLPAGLDDPLTLITYITANGNVANLAVTFNECVITACGTDLVLNGGTATLGMALSLFLQDSASSGEIPAAFQLSVSGQTFSGMTVGTFNYSYIIEAIYSSDSLKSITVKDSSPENPLVAEGVTFSSSKISELSDGC